MEQSHGKLAVTCLFLGACPGLGIIKLNFSENVTGNWFSFFFFFFIHTAHIYQRQKEGIDCWNNAVAAMHKWYSWMLAQFFGMDDIRVYIAYLHCYIKMMWMDIHSIHPVCTYKTVIFYIYRKEIYSREKCYKTLFLIPKFYSQETDSLNIKGIQRRISVNSDL